MIQDSPGGYERTKENFSPQSSNVKRKSESYLRNSNPEKSVSENRLAVRRDSFGDESRSIRRSLLDIPEKYLKVEGFPGIE